MFVSSLFTAFVLAFYVPIQIEREGVPQIYGFVSVL